VYADVVVGKRALDRIPNAHVLVKLPSLAKIAEHKLPPDRRDVQRDPIVPKEKD